MKRLSRNAQAQRDIICFQSVQITELQLQVAQLWATHTLHMELIDELAQATGKPIDWEKRRALLAAEVAQEGGAA